MLLLGVPVERIRMLGDSWSDGGLWDDIAWLALYMWEAADDDERCLRWHHLVMAVGNFNRQGGRRLRPAHVASASALESASRGDQIHIPGGPMVACEDLTSWRRTLLSGTQFAGAATAPQASAGRPRVQAVL
jgi:hypothetical protein